jgi:hypothetical protein
MSNIARRVIIRPFIKGQGPVYTVEIDDCVQRNGTVPMTHQPVGVLIRKRENGKSVVVYNEVMGVPGHECTDADSVIASAVSFYVHDAAASDPHAENLECEAAFRFEPEAR